MSLNERPQGGIQDGPLSQWPVLLQGAREGGGVPGGTRRKRLLKTEAGARAMPPPAEESLGPPGAGRGREDPAAGLRGGPAQPAPRCQAPRPQNCGRTPFCGSQPPGAWSCVTAAPGSCSSPRLFCTAWAGGHGLAGGRLFREEHVWGEATRTPPSFAAERFEGVTVLRAQTHGTQV